MAEAEKRKTVKVGCRVVNGLMIHRWKVGYDDGTGDGVKPMVHDGPGIRLNGPSSLHAGVGNTEGAGLEPGVTEVDAEWMGAVLEQNKMNPFFVQNQVYVIDEAEKGQNPTQA
jgi:hypothetical protein